MKYQTLSKLLEIINIWDNPCNYAFDLIQIWTIDNITCHIGSAPYKNVLHITLAYLG